MLRELHPERVKDWRRILEGKQDCPEAAELLAALDRCHSQSWERVAEERALTDDEATRIKALTGLDAGFTHAHYSNYIPATDRELSALTHKLISCWRRIPDLPPAVPERVCRCAGEVLSEALAAKGAHSRDWLVGPKVLGKKEVSK